MSASTTDHQLHFSIENPTKINLNLATPNSQTSRPIGSYLNQNRNQPITSNPMIVNSHPYNPSQQTQQQRCVGLNLQKQQQIDHPSRLLSSQQNSLYGSTFNQSTTALPTTMNRQQQQQSQQSHMLDLANLQQDAFESAYDIASSNNNQLSDQRRLNEMNQLQQANDTSLYSPSSSTSLLYHIYDQINLPNELNQQQYQQDQLIGSKNTTTVLNPANLFGNTNNYNNNNGSGSSNTSNTSNVNHQLISGNNNNNQPALPLPMQLHQVSELQKNFVQQQQQNYYGSSTAATNSISQNQYQPGQQAFNTLHHHPQQQHQLPSYLTSNNNNLMLDSVMRQHATLRHQPSNHQRPLSSSGVSSLSNQSVPITYGRQPRTNSSGIGKNQSNLASVLQSSNTLNHLGILNTNCSSPTTLNRNEKSLFNHHHSKTTNDHFKGIKQRLRNYIYEYKTIVKCSILLILLALCLMSIIKFTLLSSSSSSSINYNHQYHSNQAPPSSSHFSNTLMNSPSLITKPIELGLDNAIVSPQPEINGEDETASEQARQDVLKSKLLIGEFVILSQNYTNSPSQKAHQAESVVKLMEQVFLATDVRKVYSRMEVTNIRENRPSGIIVDCNIVLSESIAYAAQQFGIALYDSLAKSHERLANQAGYIIDKNSIRFNTVPDKDITSGIVPPGLISPAVSKELMNSGSVAPPVANPIGNNNLPPANLDNLDLVVWSAWSPWSSCVDKNGICDPTRIRSRLRKCVAQHTGEKVDSVQCKQRFNINDQELEVEDCSKVCFQPAAAIVGPQTAPSVMIPPYSSSSLQNRDNNNSPPANLDNLDSVVWSAWSPWSSCVDKNGICDPTRIHSRLRKCVAQHTGEKVDSVQCKQRFNINDQELEVEDCSKVCFQPVAAIVGPAQDHIMSDAPSLVGPQTAPSVMVNNELPSSMIPPYSSSSLQNRDNNNNKPSMSAITSGSGKDNSNSDLVDVYTPAAATLLNSQPGAPSSTLGSSPVATPTTERSPGSEPNIISSTLMPTLVEHQQQMSCSNCTSDEICLLLMQQKVPFCAKIKDRRDESGCGGWCKAHSQLCQPVGQNAFKCIHDSECLAEEWRCHDSACIPLSKRCDGHSNCYDSSDERDCPII